MAVRQLSHVYTDQELLNLQQTLYDSRNPTRRWLHRTRRDWILAQIQRYGDGCRRALEVGPGSGIYLPALSATAEEVIAADIEEAYLQQARELAAGLGNLECVRDDITATRLQPGSFDLILCTEVIEHIEDSSAALRCLGNLLSPTGTLILSTPQRYSPLEVCARIAFLPGIIQLVRLIYREPVIETGHINLLTEAALSKQLESAGLRTLAAYKSGFYLPLIAELLGGVGQKWLSSCEARLRDSRLDWLLWTQYRILARQEW